MIVSVLSTLLAHVVAARVSNPMGGSPTGTGTPVGLPQVSQRAGPDRRCEMCARDDGRQGADEDAERRRHRGDQLTGRLAGGNDGGHSQGVPSVFRRRLVAPSSGCTA